MYQFKNRVDVELESILYRANASKHFVQPCRPTNALIYYVSGGHRFDFEEFSIECREGEILYLPQGSTYTNHLLSKDTEYYQINFNLYDENRSVVLFDNPTILDKSRAQKHISLFSDSYNHYVNRSFGFVPSCISNILGLIAVFSTEEIEKSGRGIEINRIANTLAYIDEYYNLETPVTELAKLSSTSVSNLEKIFKKCFSMSPSAYRNKIRIEHAKQLLAGGYSIEKAAYLSGFSDRYYFSKTFKKITGITPSVFMHSHEI